MQYTQSLRHRIQLSFALFGALLSIVIATGVHFAVEDIEDELVERGLEHELKYLLQDKRIQLGSNQQISADIMLHYVNEQNRDTLPVYIRDIPKGHSDFKHNAELYYTLVTDVEDGTIYLVRDATAFEHLEVTIQIALIASVIVSTLIALWLGNWLSARVISPVSTLAKQVSEMKPGQKNPQSLANQYANDEVGQLAAKFDNYLQQMEQFVTREQEFTADASHELRTPLTVINGAAELLLENPDLTDRALKQVERIARAGGRMHSMLEILLLLARETPSHHAAHHENCNIQEIISEIVEQHLFLAQEKSLQLHCEIQENFTLSTTKTALTIVLSNLVRNAINYTSQGEITIKVRSQAIEINYSGEGIANEALEHIFDRHYRGVNSKGSGIGLSIVKRICDRSGWTINIESKLEQGTQVTLTF
ncbi:sensor histidine kinase [Pseudomonadota bacterium]